MIVRVVALTVSLVFLGQSVARAGVDDALRDLFTSWGTYTTNTPGVYDAQRRGYLSGGNFNVRVYRRPLPPLVGFSPPRFSAGCNGADVYLGAMSYAKADRYVQLLQQLGMSVVAGYAFQIAMKELCETCKSVLDNLENAIRNVNALVNLQPCQASLAQMQNQLDKTVSAVSDTWEATKTAAGEIGDKLEGRDQRGSKSIADAVAELAGSDSTRLTINLVWDALMTAGLDAESATLIMSTTGTIVMGADGLPEIFEGHLDFDALVDAVPGQTVTLLRCQGASFGRGECLTVDAADDTTVTGFGPRVRDAMVGIGDKLRAHATPLTDEEKAMVKLAPVPLYRRLADQSTSPDQMAGFITQHADTIGVKMAAWWVQWAVREALRQSYQVNKIYPKAMLPEPMLDRFREMVRERGRQADAEANRRLLSAQRLVREDGASPQTAQGGGGGVLKQLQRRSGAAPSIQAGR